MSNGQTWAADKDEKENTVENYQDCPLCGSKVCIDKLNSGMLQVRCLRQNCNLQYTGGAGNELALQNAWGSLIARIIPAPDQNYYISTRQANGTYIVHLKGRIDKHVAMHVPSREIADKIVDMLNTTP